jgi:hypothetical protein
LTIALTFAHAALFNVLCLTGKTGSMGSRFFVANLGSDHSFLGLFLSGFSSGLFPRQPLAAFGGGLLELCITFCPLLFLRLRRCRGDSRPGCRLWGAQGIMIAIKVVVGAVFVYLAAAAGGGP